PGARCLESADGEEVAPPGVLDRLVEAGLVAGSVVLVAAITIRDRGTAPTQVGRLNRLDVDHVVVADQGECRLVVEVAALPAHMLMLLAAPAHRLCSSLAALLAAGDVPLGFLQHLLSLAVVAGILHDVAVRRDKKHLQPDIYGGLPSAEGQRL